MTNLRTIECFAITEGLCTTCCAAALGKKRMSQNGKTLNAKFLSGMSKTGTGLFPPLHCLHLGARLRRLAKANERVATLGIRQFFLVVCFALTYLSGNEVIGMTTEDFKELLGNPSFVGKVRLEFAGASQLANKDLKNVIGTAYEFGWLERNFKIKQILTRQGSGQEESLEQEQGDFRGQSWEYAKNRLVFYEKDAQLVDDSIGSRFILQTFLHFGLQYLAPETVVWKGNSFTAKVVVDNQKFPIIGDLVVDTDQKRVVGLNYKWIDGVFSYRINYYFNDASNGAVRLPSKMVIYGFGAIGDNPLMVFDQIQYEPKVVLSDLDPDIIFSKSQKVRVTKAGIKGSSIPVQANEVHNVIATKSRLAILVAFALSTGFIAWLIFRSGITKKQQ